MNNNHTRKGQPCSLAKRIAMDKGAPVKVAPVRNDAPDPWQKRIVSTPDDRLVDWRACGNGHVRRVHVPQVTAITGAAM
jgi:hypothetical protein